MPIRDASSRQNELMPVDQRSQSMFAHRNPTTASAARDGTLRRQPSNETLQGNDEVPKLKRQGSNATMRSQATTVTEKGETSIKDKSGKIFKGVKDRLKKPGNDKESGGNAAA
ncbi:hypothetical protein LTR95_004908 [Oleoguttula sp. CCFEE 5521]